MDIYELLKRDHEEVSELFEMIDNNIDDGEQGLSELFDQLKTELTAHAKAEQEVFYEPLRMLLSEEESEELRWEGEEEHHVIALLLNELSRVPISSEPWLAKVKVLNELVKHHVEEEESRIFELAQSVFSEEEAKVIAINMEEVKDLYRDKVDDALAEDLIYLMPEAEEEIFQPKEA